MPLSEKVRIELKRTEPPLVIPKVRVRVGESFPVAATILADDIRVCEVFLRVDELILEETTRHPNPWTFAGPYVHEQVRWELRGTKVVSETHVRMDAEGNGLPQLSEFAVEVTQ